MAEPANSIGWLPLVGVVVGFGLGEGTRYVRYRWEIHRNRRLVRAELESVLAQLPQKRDILKKGIAALREGRILPMLAVRTITVGYSTVLSSLYPHLSPMQRNCLHVIYERVRVTDEVMDSFQDKVLAAVRENTIVKPFEVYAGILDDMLNSLEVVEQLAKSYLAGKPTDVFAVEHRDG